VWLQVSKEDEMSQPVFSKLKPYRVHVLYFFIIWWTPAILLDVFGKAGGMTGGILQGLVFTAAALFLLGALIRSKNTYVLGLFLFMSVLGLFRFITVLNMHSKDSIKDPYGLFVFLVSLIAIMVTTHKFSSGFIWYRHLPLLLDLAAKPVVEATNGYTNRPFPVGKFDYSREEALGFAGYLNKELTAVTYVEDERVVLVFSNGLFQYIPFVKPGFDRLTYVSIGFGGGIDVNFARRDYQKYRDEVTFDRLCNSFGQLIIDFFNAYRKGNADKFFQDLLRQGMEIGEADMDPAAAGKNNKEEKMATITKTLTKTRIQAIQPGWVILSGLFAFLVFITVEGIIEGMYTFAIDPRLLTVYEGITRDWSTLQKAVNILVNAAKFIIFMWIYAALIPRFGATVKNAMLTTLIVFVLLYLQVFNEFNQGLMVSVPASLWISDVIFNLIELPVAIAAGAWLYRGA
jgi:hypothetical protein